MSGDPKTNDPHLYESIVGVIGEEGFLSRDKINLQRRRLLAREAIRVAKRDNLHSWGNIKEALRERSAMGSIRAFMTGVSSSMNYPERTAILTASSELTKTRPTEKQIDEQIESILDNHDDAKDWFLTRLFEAVDAGEWRQVGIMAARAHRGDFS